MGHILVKQRFNWADEIDFGGFLVMTQEELDKHFHDVEFGFEDEGYHVEPTEFPYECYVGSNESIIIKNIEAYKRYFKTMPITEEEAIFLKKAFGGNFGNIIYIED